MRRALVAAVVALSAVCAVADTVITSAHLGLLSERAWASHGWPLITLTTLGCAVMGGLIVSRQPRHPVGWLLLVASTTSVSLPAEVYSLWVLEGDGPGPTTAGHLAAWLSVASSAPLGIAALVVVFLIAPDGRLRSPRWRWVVVAAGAGLALYLAGIALLPPTRHDISDPYGPVVAPLVAAGVLLILAALVAAVVCLLLRTRQTHGEPRRQLLWLAASAALVAAALVLTVVVEVSGSTRTGAASTVLFASYLTMPVAIAVAVLRHRLLDIEVIVNQALVVTIATALVAGAYVGIVVTVGPLVTVDEGVLPSLLTTAAVALAFQPLRRGVVRVADRLAYGPAAVPYDALAELSRRLGDSPDPTSLLPSIADATGRAAGAQRVVVRMAVQDGSDRTATWPVEAAPGTGPTVALPLADAGEGLGSLTVEMPPGRPMRADELALVRGLAQAAGTPLRGARLAAALPAQVDALHLATHHLEASQRRLVSAVDVERSRLQRELARDVVPHLSGLPSQLERLASRPVRPADVEPLVVLAVDALEALREITRGVYPAQLARAGLEPALRSFAARVGGLVLSVEGTPGLRWHADVEAAAYACVVEAVRALAAPVAVVLSGAPTGPVVVVRGGAAGTTHLLQAGRDRVEAVGGTLEVRGSGGRVHVEARLPPAQSPARAQASVSTAGPSSDFGT